MHGRPCKVSSRFGGGAGGGGGGGDCVQGLG